MLIIMRKGQCEDREELKMILSQELEKIILDIVE